MSDTAPARHLRERAARLRQLALDIEQLPVMRLDRHADDDTWRGTRPALCRAALASNQRRLHAAAEELRWQAYGLERDADELDLLAARQVSPTG